MNKKNYHILITGRAGFIGTNLCKRLLDEGMLVTCIDNLSTGKMDNVTLFASYSTYKFIEADIRNTEENDISSDVNFIINFACQASPKAYYKKTIDTLMTSVVGVKQMLDLATKRNIRILHSSTSEVYGDPLVDILDEDYHGNVSCTGTRACYDEGKRAEKTLCMDYKRQFGADVRIIRIFNTYGPYMQRHDGRAIPAFIDNVLQNKEIEVFGSGNQTRSFQYIDDLVNAIVKIIFDNIMFDSPVNIGNPNEEYTINELAEKISNLLHNPAIINYSKGFEDDPKKRRPNISRAKRLLNWQPRVSLDEGLINTINYFKSL